MSKWIEAKNGTFWIRGKEGSGKSVAMKHFFTEYKKRKDTEFVIGFFFNKLGSDLEKCFEGLLRVALARIIRGYPALFTCIQHHYDHMVLEQPYDRNTTSADWTLGDLEHAMELIINNTQFDANIVLFVDALNECEDKDLGEEKLIQIFRGYSEQRPLVNFKICFSSTTNIDLEEKYAGQLPGLVMQEKTEVDLELYIRTCFNDGRQSSRFDENDLAQILAGVLNKAEGCWLWVEYAVALVNKRSSTLGTVKRGLEKLPKEMTALYESFLISVNNEHAEETNNMLAVVLAAAASCSPPSIAIDDFRYILGFCSEDQYESQALVEGQDDFMKTNALLRARIQERFGHLLIVQNLDDDDADDEADSKKRDKNGTVKLYHSTVKDFLSQRKTAGESLILSGQDLERRGFEILTTASLRFLKCREFIKLVQDLESQGVKYFKKVEDARAVFKRLPLLVFTLKFFLINSCYAIQRNTGNSDELKSYWTSRNFEVWKSITNILLERDAIEPDATLTASCVETNCDVFVRHQIETQGVEPNELIPDYGSYLCLAAFWGSDKVVKMLLSLRPQVDIDFCSSFGTALTIAAARGYKDIVQDLLDNGADADISGGIYEDPLAAASTSLNFDIVRLLWEHPSSSSSLKHSKCRTSRALLAIGGAIRYAFVVEDAELSNSERRVASEVIQILVRNGLEMSIFTHISVPIFLWSLSIGSTEVMDLMLKDPTFILFQSSSGQTLLHIVSTTATLDMVKLVIEKYEDLDRSIDVRDGRECTVLHYAAINGSPDVIQYLLDLKDPQLDPNAKDMYGLTPLHAAFANGRAKTVSLLLEAGAIIDDDGPEGLSMLHLAVSNFSEPEVLEFLTDRPVNVTDDWKRTPLHIACQFGGRKAVEWLLDRNLDPSTQDARGRTALHCACQNQAPSSAEIIELLLKKGASPSTTDAAGSTPLHSAFHDPEHASSCLFWAVLEKNYWDKFSEAECARKVYVMLALDQEDEFINIQDDLGNTPLHLACWRGLGAIIGILISLRARLDLRDRSGCLAYQLIENSELRESAEIIMTTVQGENRILEITSS